MKESLLSINYIGEEVACIDKQGDFHCYDKEKMVKSLHKIGELYQGDIKALLELEGRFER